MAIKYRYRDAHEEPYLEQWPVVKETRCTITVELYGETHKILKDAVKRWAYDTVELALASYIARKRKQVQILEHQLAITKRRLGFATGWHTTKRITHVHMR